MNAFTIKDLENLTGIKAHTIRIWEQRYHFLKPQRTATNIRYYSNEELKTILNVALLSKYGFKISHIDRMSQSELSERIFGLGDQQAQSERMVGNLIRHMVDLDMEAFGAELDRHIQARGMEATINRLVFPFLEKIGILWTTGHINPAQEHLVSNIIRQKLVVGIERAAPAVPLPRTFLLFLPEGEHHELGLLYVHYLLKARGVKIVYLGADVPLSDVEYVAGIKNPDFLYIHLTGTGLGAHLEKYVHQLHAKIPGSALAISGAGVRALRTTEEPKTIVLHSLTALHEFVGQLA